MYIYEDHLGGLYTSVHELSYEETYCEQCRDSDWLIGYAANRADAWELLKDDWNPEYVKRFIVYNWEE